MFQSRAVSFGNLVCHHKKFQNLLSDGKHVFVVISYVYSWNFLAFFSFTSKQLPRATKIPQYDEFSSQIVLRTINQTYLLKRREIGNRNHNLSLSTPIKLSH
jgi:hypothetical protein